MRQIVLDTETTGLNPQDGHKIIEIGCVELVDRRLTGRRFHEYLNPDRLIDAGAQEVHGISNAFLADKKRFGEIADDFLAFVKDAELIIHNAAFDVGFINHELGLLPGGRGALNDHCLEVIDTLAMARKKYPGQRNNLDALCKRLGIDNSRRELHGALLDAEILADVYLSMTGGQMTLLEEDVLTPTIAAEVTPNQPRQIARPALRTVHCNEEELQSHLRRLEFLKKASGDNCLWLNCAAG
ncbi:MAG: DNA polymerase III subunit epsilon [Methylococcaceae bacterium]|nr:MAG: DNA polymerase III subunit epsilon [Methylococcaceae bacterium]